MHSMQDSVEALPSFLCESAGAERVRTGHIPNGSIPVLQLRCQHGSIPFIPAPGPRRFSHLTLPDMHRC